MTDKDIAAERINVILRREFYRDDVESGMLDALICMMHLCDRECIDWQTISEFARRHYLKEAADCGGTDGGCPDCLAGDV